MADKESINGYYKVNEFFTKEHIENERTKVEEFINKLKSEGKDPTLTEGTMYFVVKYQEAAEL